MNPVQFTAALLGSFLVVFTVLLLVLGFGYFKQYLSVDRETLLQEICDRGFDIFENLKTENSTPTNPPREDLMRAEEYFRPSQDSFLLRFLWQPVFFFIFGIFGILAGLITPNLFLVIASGFTAVTALGAGIYIFLFYTHAKVQWSYLISRYELATLTQGFDYTLASGERCIIRATLHFNETADPDIVISGLRADLARLCSTLESPPPYDEVKKTLEDAAASRKGPAKLRVFWAEVQEVGTTTQRDHHDIDVGYSRS